MSKPNPNVNPRKHKKRFSGFTANLALEKLQVDRLIPWHLETKPYQPSPFLAERLRRLENFDLSFSERSRELLIDAFCEEVIDHYPQLKIWKAAPLESADAIGQADYLITPRKAYITTPLLCVIEAKKDDFEQGLAQCLVEMEACAWTNQQSGLAIDSYGIVTSGEVWKFYELTLDRQVFETPTLDRRSRSGVGVSGCHLCGMPGAARSPRVIVTRLRPMLLLMPIPGVGDDRL